MNSDNTTMKRLQSSLIFFLIVQRQLSTLRANTN